MITLLNMRSTAQKSPEGVHAEKTGDNLVIYYSIDGHETKISWQLHTHMAKIEN